MAKVKYREEEVSVSGGSEMKAPCEKLGVPFRCKSGSCGSCMIEVLKGKENLSELTKQEKNLGMDEENRLACQCCIQKSEVEIDF